MSPEPSEHQSTPGLDLPFHPGIHDAVFTYAIHSASFTHLLALRAVSRFTRMAVDTYLTSHIYLTAPTASPATLYTAAVPAPPTAPGHRIPALYNVLHTAKPQFAQPRDRIIWSTALQHTQLVDLRCPVPPNIYKIVCEAITHQLTAVRNVIDPHAPRGTHARPFPVLTTLTAPVFVSVVPFVTDDNLGHACRTLTPTGCKRVVIVQQYPADGAGWEDASGAALKWSSGHWPRTKYEFAEDEELVVVFQPTGRVPEDGVGPDHAPPRDERRERFNVVDWGVLRHIHDWLRIQQDVPNVVIVDAPCPRYPEWFAHPAGMSRDEGWRQLKRDFIEFNGLEPDEEDQIRFVDRESWLEELGEVERLDVDLAIRG